MIKQYYFRPKFHYPQMPYFKLLDQSAARHPEKTAIVFNDYSLSYRELMSIIHSLCNGLKDLGIAQGDRVGILLPNNLEFIVSTQAVSRCGAISSPMNVSSKMREIVFQLRTIRATTLIAGKQFFTLFEKLKAEVPELKTIIVAEEVDGYPSLHRLIRQYPAEPPADIPIDGSDPVFIPFSSGTTGLPKGVVLTHRNIVANYIQCMYGYSIRETDIIPLFLPMYHIYGSMIAGATLAVGGTILLMAKFEMEAFLKLTESYRGTIWFTVPPVINQITYYENLEHYNISSVRYTLSGAAPLADQLRVKFQEKTKLNVVEGYGMTEAASFVCSPPVNDPELWKIGSVGLPVSDTFVEIVDSEQGTTPLLAHEIGEIRVKGPQIMHEYWEAEEATQSSLRDGWYYTGDLGYLDEDGYLFIVDRKKEMIKYNGFAVAPAELEMILFTHPAVKDCAVIGKTDIVAGEIPIAFVVLHENASVSIEEMLDFVSEKVAGYKKIRELQIIDQIPRSSSGKLLRRALKQEIH